MLSLWQPTLERTFFLLHCLLTWKLTSCFKLLLIFLAASLPNFRVILFSISCFWFPLSFFSLSRAGDSMRPGSLWPSARDMLVKTLLVISLEIIPLLLCLYLSKNNMHFTCLLEGSSGFRRCSFEQFEIGGSNTDQWPGSLYHETSEKQSGMLNIYKDFDWGKYNIWE